MRENINDPEEIVKTETLKLVTYSLEHYMGIEYGEFDFSGKDNIIIVSGKNEAGKSRFIGGIPFALGINKVEEPITPGRKTGKVTLKYSGDREIEVEKRFSKNSSPPLVVKVNGVPINSPQKFLNALVSEVAMNPVEFHTKYDDKKRLDFLYKVMGNKDKIEAYDAEYKRYYEERKYVNNDIKNLKGKLSDAPADDGTKEVSISDLLAQLNIEQERMGKLDRIQEKKDALTIKLNQLDVNHSQNLSSISELEEKIKELKDENNLYENSIGKLKDEILSIEDEINSFPESGESEIQNRINSAEEINAKARDIAQAKEKRNELKTAQNKSDGFTRKLEEMKQKKIDMLSQSNIPIKNLTIEEGEILINGLPWNQQSTAEGVLNAMHIANMKKTEIKNMEMTWDHLDSESRQAVINFAKENDYTVFAEMVSDGKTNESTVHMDNGQAELF